QEEGVQKTASGLLYKVVKQGNGVKPKADDRVKVHYEGRLIDGTVFDSSLQRGEPAVFPVSGVIAGFKEALMLMPVGSEWEIYIPQNLAYGEQDMGTIKPYSTLIFKLQLLGIEK
nr:FKBP-type peptidyl-prolyl cis-trans isomerase [Prevotella sp.]